MLHIFIMLLLLTGIAGQAVRAGDQPADSSDTIPQPAETTQESGAGSDDSKEGKEGKEGKAGEDEPDCE
jgi:hypothetical protein